tara:strand:- start:639 stop:1535 length:897 start_codon:yes stop_codon:yes gene_type:complete
MTSDKPLLVINAGVAWSGTKPYCKTLQKCQKIVHHGYVVENNILYYLYLLQTDPKQAKRYFDTRHKFRVQSAINSNAQTLDTEYLQNIFKKRSTIHTYIKYHLDCWERNKKKGYIGISDFSNSNSMLPSEFLATIKNELEKHFTVKATVIFRNPVKRSYSEASVEYKYNTEQSPMEWQGGTADVRGYKDSIAYWKSKRIDHNCDYVGIYKNWKRVFDTYPIIMEDLWCDQSGLSAFLGCDINSVHQNIYSYNYGLYQDHTPQDLQELSDADLIWGMNKLGKVYEEWDKEFGYIPQSWL